MEQRIVCITAGQRAGTTALQQALAASGRVHNFGEIFQHSEGPAAETRRSFSSFATANAIGLADTLGPGGAAAVTRGYLEWLREGAAPKHVLIDVKLNSWLALSPPWRYPHDEPFLLSCLKQQNAVVIFLWRRDMAEQILSLFISRQLGVWHNLTPERVGKPRLSAPIPELRRLTALLCRSEADMFEHLADYRNKIVISYEELYRDGAPGESFCRQLRDLTGIELRDRPLRIRPNTLPKRDVVANYDEAVRAISAIAEQYRRPVHTPSSAAMTHPAG